GEMTLVVKPGHLGLPKEPPASGADRAQLAAGGAQARAEVPVHAAALAEQVHVPRREQALVDAGAEVAFGPAKRGLRHPAFRGAKLPDQLALSATGGRDQPAAEVRDRAYQLRVGHPEAHRAADRIEQAVALADETIEVGQRLDPRRPCLAIIGDDRQPEPELREPDRGGAPVDAEQAALQNAAAARGE